MKTFRISLCSVLLVPALQAAIVVNDHFDNDALDPAWEISFINSTNWTYSETGTELNVTDITAPVTNKWNRVRLTQTFSPLSDFDATINLSWNSEGSNYPLQSVGIILADSSGNVVFQGHFVDAWIARSGSRVFDDTKREHSQLWLRLTPVERLSDH